MPTNSTISIDRLELIKKLESVIAEKTKEQDEWEKSQKTLVKRIAAWEKKAVDYIRKNGKFLGDSDDLSPQCDWRQEKYHLPFSVTAEELHAAIGEKPEGGQQPDFFVRPWGSSKNLSPADEIRNAIALYKLTTETTIKVSTKAAWASYLV